MKKQFLALAMGAAALFTGCQENSLPVEFNSTKFNVTVEEGVSSRAASEVNNYIMGIYDESGVEVKHIDQTTGTFSVELMDGQDYTAIFWADVDGDAVYNTTDLKAVALTADKAVEAWAGSVDFNTDDESVSVTLNRAVAKLTLKETGNIPAGSTLTVTSTQFTTFNAETRTVTDATKAYTTTVDLAKGITATEAAPEELATDLYVLASEAGNVLAEAQFVMTDSEDVQFSSITASNIPVSANRNTNITGHYVTSSNFTLTVTCDDAWDTENNDAILGDNSTDEPTTPATPVISDIEDVTFVAEGETKTVEVEVADQGDAVVEVATSNDFFTVSIEGNIITIVAAENTATTPKISTVTVSVEGAEDVEFKLVQAAAEPKTPAIAFSGAPASLDLKAEGETKKITINITNGTKADVTYTGLSGLLSCAEFTLGSTDTKLVLDVTAAANTDQTVVNQTLTVSIAGGNTITLPITIAAAEAPVVDPSATSIVLKPENFPTSYTTNGNITVDDYNFAINQVANMNKAGKLQFKSGTATYIYNNEAIDGIKEIIITKNNAYFLSVYAGTSKNPSGQAIEASIDGDIYTYAVPAGSKYISIKNGSNASYANQIEIKAVAGDDSGEVTPDPSNATEIIPEDLETKNAEDLTTYTIGNYTLTFTKTSGSNPPKYYEDSTIRMYNASILQITATNGSMSKITFDLSKGSIDGADYGTYNNEVWTGDSKSVTFSVKETINIKSITIE